MARGDPCEECGEWVDWGLHHECAPEYRLPIAEAAAEKWRAAYIESQSDLYRSTTENERLRDALEKIAEPGSTGVTIIAREALSVKP